MSILEHELVTIKDDVRVAVPRSLDLITPYVLKEQLDWFEDEMRFVRRLVSPGMNVVDVGANYGAYALTMAKRALPNGKVWAFEPGKRTAEHLRRGVAANGLSNLEVIEAALSNREGTATLYTEANSELNTLNPTSSTRSSRETIEVMSLDGCRERLGLRDVAFMKVDAEGEEARIFEGAEAFLDANDPLCMFELKHGDAVNVSLVDWFRAHGFTTYRIVPGLDVLIPFALQSIDPYQLNLFACRRSRAEQLAQRGLLAPDVPAASELSPVDATRWSAFTRGMPYAERLTPAWRDSGATPTPGRDRAEAAIAWYAEAHTSADRSSVDRCGALSASFDAIAGALADAERTSRLLTAARISADVGQRMLAVQMLEAISAALQEGAPIDLDEPFLSPNPRFDSIPPDGRLAEWCLAAVIEQLERLGHYSSFYTLDASAARLTLFQQLGFPSDEMARRLSLVEARRREIV